MNKFKPNTEVIKKIGEEISKSAELFGWQFRDLSLQENMLLNKFMNKMKHASSNHAQSVLILLLFILF